MNSPNPNSPFYTVVGLGPLKTEYPYPSGRKWAGLIFGLLCLFASPMLLLLAAYLGYDAYNRFGVRRVDDEVIVPLVFAGIAFLVGALLVFNAWRNWSVAAALYENGFAYNDRKGLRQVRWDQIAAVWQSITKHYRNGIYVGTTHIYTVQTNDNQKIILDDKFKKVEDLGNAVLKGSTNALWPKYWQQAQSGQRITFGPLALDTQGMYTGKKSLLWNDIKAVKIQSGTISVSKKDGGWFAWTTASVPQIPNFYIFYELVGKFAKIE
jgi:hypothetical protein